MKGNAKKGLFAGFPPFESAAGYLELRIKQFGGKQLAGQEKVDPGNLPALRANDRLSGEVESDGEKIPREVVEVTDEKKSFRLNFFAHLFGHPD